MFSDIIKYLSKPALYEPSTNSLWDDDHISRGMLKAHLNPDVDAASRKPEFIEKSVKWIADIAPSSQYKRLLDIGCGPGLYAERFHNAGYQVTGIDFSKRSISYAKEQTIHNKSNIEYHYQNYLTIDYKEQFDIVTLIYCDYSVLSIQDRLLLLNKIQQALKPNGKLIFDVFTPRMRKEESHTWYYAKEGGFFSEKPHICLESLYQYDDEDNTELCQYIIQTEDRIDCYNVWNHYFTKDKLLAEGKAARFRSYEFYGDVVGNEFSDDGETICGVYTK